MVKALHKKTYRLLCVVFLLSVFVSTKAHATTEDLTTSIGVTSACSLSVTSGTNHATTLSSGMNNTIGSSSIKTVCNDASGFAVYAVGYGNDTYGDNTLTATINDTPVTIATNATASPTSSTPSEWNMTVANASVQNNYTATIMNQTTGQNPVGNFGAPHAIPSAYTKIAYRNTGTDVGTGADYTTGATGANLSVTFNAYVAPTQVAGLYTGAIKFLLIHPNVLTYDSQTGEPATYEADTLASEPPIGGCPINSPILQNVSSWASTVELGQTIDVVDSRDRQCYKVSRFKMNSAGTQTALWMSNLNLGAEELVVDTLDSTNTHLPSDNSKDISATTFNTWIKSSGTASYTDPELIPITTSNSSNGQNEDAYGNKYGTLYNYASASAGTYTYPNGEGIGGAEYDLCPAGWRLPTGGRNGTNEEFEQLVTNGYDIPTAGSTSAQQDLMFSLAGQFFTTPAWQGSVGHYWSSSNNGDNGYYIFILYLGTTNVSPVSDNNRNVGLSIKCIAQ